VVYALEWSAEGVPGFIVCDDDFGVAEGAMWRNRVTDWRKDIVGDWQPEKCGVDLLYLEPAAGRFDAVLSLRADGTWGWPYSADRSVPPDLPARLRWPWELSDDRALSLWRPIPPMPEYGMPEWSREEKQWLVLAVADLSLALADSHHVIVLRRINSEEYNRRKADEYSRLVEAFGGMTKYPRLSGGPEDGRGV
jgi:hypothetical protein